MDLNRAVYESPHVYKYYLSTALMPSEAACLLKYHSHIANRDVLDIGVGAGRTAYHLSRLAKHYEAVDYSTVMVGYMKKSAPEISVQQADFRDLRAFESGSFDFVLASNNVIDSLSHEGRLQALKEAYRVLRPGGILAFSSHNLNYRRAFDAPRLNWSWNPVRLLVSGGRYLRSYVNYLRFRSLRQVTPCYAIINDAGHYFACLHYYITRSEMASQLAGAGFVLKEAFDGLGNVSPERADDSVEPSFLYAAERLPD
jgi:SAM-dependent methyltransferase